MGKAMASNNLIDWKRVDEKLRCPKCGDKAHISGGTDGTEAEHTHHFTVSREEAMRLSRLTVDEAKERITMLEAELRELKRIVLEDQ